MSEEDGQSRTMRRQGTKAKLRKKVQNHTKATIRAARKGRA